LSREYAVDPLEILFVREVMRTNVAVLPADVAIEDLARALRDDASPRLQRLYPVVDADGRLAGVIRRRDLQRTVRDYRVAGVERPLAEAMKTRPVVAYADEPLRVVVYRMAETSLTRLPVVDRKDPRRLVGMISLSDLLAARLRHLEEERRRERVLRLRLPFRPPPTREVA
jgi:CBS domain-containing protein